MSIIRKTLLVCDRCRKAVETADSVAEYGLPPFPEGELAGWIETGKDHHLCPRCAKPYQDRKAEMERELKQLAGIETVEVSI